MKIRSVSIEGFRGFNDKRDLTFNENLSVIFGPNSYGKTSISEALEWLLFGVTSKVENPQSGKIEYKGSYRNCHYPKDNTPYVEATFGDIDNNLIILRGELGRNEVIKKYINGNEVEFWPWEEEKKKICPPFILQHALQDLLLTSPKDRYEGFSRIIGTDKLNEFQSFFISLATKFNTPEEVIEFVNSFKEIEKRMDEDDDLAKLYREYKRNDKEKYYESLLETCNNIIEEELPSLMSDEELNDLIGELTDKRQEKLKGIFDKRIKIDELSKSENASFQKNKEELEKLFSQELLDDYLYLMKLTTIQAILDKATFFNLGLKLLIKSKETCPFCGSDIDEEKRKGIHENHENCSKEAKDHESIIDKQTKLLEDLKYFRNLLKRNYDLLIYKSKAIIQFFEPENFRRLEDLLEMEAEDHLKVVNRALKDFKPIYENLSLYNKEMKGLLLNTEESINSKDVKKEIIQSLGEKTVAFLANADNYAQLISIHSEPLSEANKVLVEILDRLAGTEKLAILIDLLCRKKDIEKLFQIRVTLDSLSKLRSKVSEYVSNKIRIVVEEQLTDDVMEWYEQIKTISDPKVHFSGFVLPTTRSGTTVSQKIGVSAESYGKELISAVSSLSESKLNALGLSIKISNNLKSSNPFNFLVIDDPVQSLDDAHATQIISVIRKLVEEKEKQVVLLSHNAKWLRQVLVGCSSLNGSYLEITGYTREGPFITEASWKPWEQRLAEVDAICKNPEAGLVRLQQAEEEIRLAVCDITSLIYNKVTGKTISSHKLNSNKVNNILNECGIPVDLVNRIAQTFETTDDSHHASDEYTAEKQRILQYHSWVHELGRYV